MVSLQVNIEDFLGKGFQQPTLLYYAKNNLVTYNQVLVVFEEMLYYILDEITFEVLRWIKINVPKRTGQLRDWLSDTIEYDSKITPGKLTLELGAPVDYMTELNQMSTRKVRHFMEWGWANYYGYSGKILLNDPFAIGAFWDNLITFTLDRLTFITQRAIDEFFKGTGSLMKGIRGKLKIEAI